MDTTPDLKILLPDEEISIGGESLLLKPFPFGKLPKVIKHAGVIIGLFSSLPNSIYTTKGELNLEDPAVLIIMMQHFAESSDVLIEIACLGTGKSREWIEDLDPYDGIFLLLKIWEVNKDFFTQRLAPLLQKYKIATPPLPTEQTK